MNFGNLPSGVYFKYLSIFFLGWAFLAGFNYKNSAIQMIKEVGISRRYYPKHYIAPKKWMRKLFGIKPHLIPKYLYFELFMCLIQFALGPVNIIIALAVGQKVVVRYMMLILVNLTTAERIFFLIISALYKRK